MYSNFDFLNKYWPILAQLGANAENYVYSDPNACIYKLGLFSERLVREIMLFESISEPSTDNTHANRIRLLRRAGFLPRDIDNTLYLLRKTRNSAVHTGLDSIEDAKTLLSLAYILAVWFMKTYGDWDFNAPEFSLPEENKQSNLKQVITEQERKIADLFQNLEAVTTAASGTSKKERSKRAEAVSSMIHWTEAQTRCLIDEQLRKAGWEADTQTLRYSRGTRPVQGRNIAISEWPTDSEYLEHGHVDYAFFIGEKLVAVMDAKKMSEDVAATIDVQVKDYASHIREEDIRYTIGKWGDYQCPFLFASNGRAYLEQLRTKSGIWYLDVRDGANLPYPIRNWFSPNDIKEKLEQDIKEANRVIRVADNRFLSNPKGLNLRDYTQIEHIFAKGTPAYEEMQLDYETNLVACCDGGKKERASGTIRECDLYCEACKFQAVLPVHPLMVNCEEKFLYSDDGEMLGVYKDAEVTIKILNLNSPVIKNMRKYAIDNYALYPPISWEEELKRVQQRNSIGQYEEFYFVLESYIKTYHQGELRHEAI